MSTTVSSPPTTRRQQARRVRVAAATAGLVASAGIALSLIEASGPGEWPPSRDASPTPAAAWPGRLIADERAMIAAGLASRDSRIQRIAGSVARGETGALALADPWILHHHGVNTADQSRSTPEIAAERFHHR